MARLAFRSSAAFALAAAASMAATPAFAASFNADASAGAVAPVASAWGVDDNIAHQYRGWGRGGNRGWGGGYRHHRHGNGISTGDVLAGVLIIGGIAAIAAAASKNNRDRERERSYPDYRPDDRYPQRDDRYDYRDRNDRNPAYSDSRGLDRAAEMCVNEVERSEQVEDVGSVNRAGDGWRVEGRLRNGKDFTCEIDNNGTIRNVDLDRGVAAAPDGQWDDDAYARARERHDRTSDGA